MLEPICTDSALEAGEPLIGSAPHATAWLCLEQNGPWGRKAFTDSHLDPDLGARIETMCNDAGVRPALVRRPGRHPDEHHGGQRHVLLASTHPRRSWLLAGTVTDPGLVLGLDVAALARGDLDATRASLPGLTLQEQPHLLVCTNGTRDTCCARLGRPVVLAAAAAHADRVWEVTHTSGHRFAPTTVLLPSGHLHGRVLDGAALLEEATAGRLPLTTLRGRSSWPTHGQAAEGLVRQTHDITGLDDLVVEQQGEGWHVSHTDGRSWLVAVSESVSAAVRSESCGKPETPLRQLHARWIASDS